jgi:hypothetical protein
MDFRRFAPIIPAFRFDGDPVESYGVAAFSRAQDFRLFSIIVEIVDADPLAPMPKS